MKIGVWNYEQIVVKDDDDHLLAVISDDEIIEYEGVEVVCVPFED